MTSIKKSWFRVESKGTRYVLIMVFLFALANYPWFYFGPSISGKVIGEDGEPIEGVVVVFRFGTSGYRFFHGRKSTNIKSMETITDASGIYTFPSWVTSKKPTREFPSNSSPSIVFYKSGYKFGPNVFNDGWVGKLSMYVNYEASKTEVVLVKYKDAKAELRDWLIARWSVGPALYQRCGWRKFPNFIIEKQKVIDRLRKEPQEKKYQKLGNTIRYSQFSEFGCGSPKEFFDGFEAGLSNG